MLMVAGCEQEKASMFRYFAMALESDSDEFGYTDASDIEIESEILELGDDYEAPEPEFRRSVQSGSRDLPPVYVPQSHPAVLPPNTPAPVPTGVTGMLGAPRPKTNPAPVASSKSVSSTPNPAAAEPKGTNSAPGVKQAAAPVTAQKPSTADSSEIGRAHV